MTTTSQGQPGPGLGATATPAPASAAPRQPLLRPAAERFHSRLDWLDSWHSFSFAGHHDPRWMGFGPLRVINDDTIAAGRGFGPHPHHDMEIITVMVEGELHHRDSMGHTAVLRAGEVQVMRAGTGVVHSEMNLGGVPCRLLQIWIESSRRGLPPAYGQRAFATGAAWTPLITPDGAGDSLEIQRPIHLWRARPAAGGRLEVALPEGSQGWLQLIDGSGELGGQALERGDGLGFEAAEALPFVAGAAGADLLLFALR